jgi:hypothetical protein
VAQATAPRRLASRRVDTVIVMTNTPNTHRIMIWNDGIGSDYTVRANSVAEAIAIVERHALSLGIEFDTIEEIYADDVADDLYARTIFATDVDVYKSGSAFLVTLCGIGLDQHVYNTRHEARKFAESMIGHPVAVWLPRPD